MDVIGLKEIDWPEEGKGKAVSAKIASDNNPNPNHSSLERSPSVITGRRLFQATLSLSGASKKGMGEREGEISK